MKGFFYRRCVIDKQQQWFKVTSYGPAEVISMPFKYMTFKLKLLLSVIQDICYPTVQMTRPRSVGNDVQSGQMRSQMTKDKGDMLMLSALHMSFPTLRIVGMLCFP